MRTVLFKGVPIPLGGDFPVEGTKAPDFELTNAGLEEVSLAAFRGEWKVLSVVPSLDTGVCAASARRFNREIAAFSNVRLINVSVDLPFAQKRFCDVEQLDRILTLSAFRAPEFGLRYGVRIEGGPLRGLLARAVWILDADHIVQHAQLVPEITQEPNYEAVLRVLRQRKA